MDMAIDSTFIGQLTELGCTVEPCGSRVTCVPCRSDADHDYLVEIMPDEKALVMRASELRVSDVVSHLHETGFRWEGMEHYQAAAGHFMSWRRGEINLIVTANPDFAAKHRAATHVCRRLNLLDKPDRVALFQAVLYANQWEPEEPATPADGRGE